MPGVRPLVVFAVWAATRPGRQRESCTFRHTLDLTLAQTTLTLADFVVEVVEICRPAQSRVPWEFADIRRAVACGTVVVWLKG